MKWRKAVINTHRDLGYFFAGLTVIYAVSGIAVNHIDDWNPNYVIDTVSLEIGALDEAEPEALAAEVLRRVQVNEVPKSMIRMSEGELRIFLDQRTLRVFLPEGSVIDETVARRFAFFEMNYLHLNHGKGLWTWFADIYALGLLILACTGIFIITGKKGLGGRGRWLLLIGLAIPLIYLVLAL